MQNSQSFRAKHRHNFLTRGRLILCLVAAVSGIASRAQAAPPIDYRRDVLPILSNHCWSCHGPDETSRKADLRLDRRDAALARTADRDPAITPGNPASSELVLRIDSSDPQEIMPPPAAKKPLDAHQKEVLRKWIAAGADFAEPWAFSAPVRPRLPDVRQADWPRQTIDRFILQKLEAEGLAPSAEAPRATWLRRVTLDLTGLPPSADELSAFLADESPSADAAVVDRLLCSAPYAERMAMHWLDAARYADTNGYNNDETRSMWPWRDWVIQAFASGMPYDQFLTEQIAGDLLPEPTLAQRVATGFNRNHVLTTEGGIIEEEYHVEYVADRVHTTATVFLGLSLQCARCHDHKYDPVSQREYYQFAAFFGNVPDRVVGYSQGRMAEPLLKVPTARQSAELARLASRRDEVATLLTQRAANAAVEEVKWEQHLSTSELAKQGALGLVAHFRFDETEGNQAINSADSRRPGLIRGKVSRSPGQYGNAQDFDGTTHVVAGDVGNFDSDQPFSLAARAMPTSNEAITLLSRMDDANAYRGYDVAFEQGKLSAHFVHHWPDSAFKVVAKEPVSLNDWHHVAVTYDGSRKSTGVKLFVDGRLQEFDATTDNTLSGTLRTDKPFHIGRRQSSVPFKGRIDDVQVWAVELTPAEVANLALGVLPNRWTNLLATPRELRTQTDANLLRTYYLEHEDPVYGDLQTEQSNLPKRIEEVDKTIPVTMVMSEQEPKRPTFVLHRGQYDQRRDEVTPAVPVVLSTLPPDAPANRLGLARWLTQPAHPLTARVAVNRWWEMLFGIGLVETSEDFGVQGALPSHPELLDWLATELIRNGWDQRAILRQIVLSATYRQSSHVTPELLERDPRNRLLARSPRYRLPAETVRDSALAVSGLLRTRLGGPSVKPYQPEGLWEDVSVERREKYAPDPGDGVYRRSMYTFWKRTCPPPSMSTFDAPDRETCVVRRARTNTPLQALVLLNDPTYLEAARNLAERAVRPGTSPEQRLASAFHLVLCRPPAADEQAVFLDVYRDALQQFRQNTDAADKLLSIGQSRRRAETDAAELAAWTALMSMLLNLDEAISKT